MPHDVDIVIAGGGIAGLTLAALLAESGLDIAVVDRNGPVRVSDEPELRVSAISRASLQIFERCNITRQLLGERATAFEQMHVWDASGAGSIHFDSADMGLDTLGHIIENSRIRQALMQRLERCERVELHWSKAISAVERGDEHTMVELDDGSMLRCRLLIGADGVNSSVREAAGIEYRRSTYEQSGLVCVVATEQGHHNTAWQVFLADGPLAFLPMYRRDGKDLCSIVWTQPSELAQSHADMDAAQFIAELERAFQHRLGGLELVSARAVFPLQHGHVEQYVQPGLALIGDAAHVIHPLAGQGANLGILDAESLADVVSRALDEGRDWAALHTLRAYERSRKGENLLMEKAMSGFNRLFSNDDQWLAMVRNAGLNLVDHAGFVKHRFMKHAMGI